ncbi:HAD family hydrolase [Sediminivirga luteola]|uniref:HAD family hydrolase n=1 Tax=Sediminivirga luteola TaxID=1774748 RepID=UPI001F5842E7|nr:HAD family phosphatase [Sediminivirga luteola]MCI2265018.1 HAD family phosphatase [Sediminivirga luteola]
MSQTLLDAPAVLFDFNGTLSDDEGVLARIVRDLAADRLGLQLSADEYETDLRGLSDGEILRELLRRAGDAGRAGRVGQADVAGRAGEAEELAALREELSARYLEAACTGTLIRAEARELVRRLHARGTRLAIVTGASRALVEPALEGAGIRELFEVLVTEEDVAEGKPDPEGFLRAASVLGLSGRAADVVVFEDSAPGLEAAARAGMIGVRVAWDEAPLGVHLLDAPLIGA